MFSLLLLLIPLPPAAAATAPTPALLPRNCICVSSCASSAWQKFSFIFRRLNC